MSPEAPFLLPTLTRWSLGESLVPSLISGWGRGWTSLTHTPVVFCVTASNPGLGVFSPWLMLQHL